MRLLAGAPAAAAGSPSEAEVWGKLLAGAPAVSRWQAAFAAACGPDWDAVNAMLSKVAARAAAGAAATTPPAR